MPLSVTNCTIDTNSLTITFSDPVVFGGAKNAADNLANYSVFDPGSPDFSQPRHLTNTIADIATINNRSVKITFKPSTGSKTTEFQSGDWVNIAMKRIEALDATPFEDGIFAIARQVPGKGGTGRIVSDVEDAISYPILTEEIGYRPSPVGIAAGGGNGFSGASGNLGQLAAKTVSEVLGWKPNAGDPKGFVGALTQSFTLSDVEGHVESAWIQRPYTVQTDIGGGIMGAQASLFTRAKSSLDAALPLLDGLYPLDPEADPEYVKALREMARSQMSEIVKELGLVGLPSILRIDTYFEILLGQNPSRIASAGVQFDPDQIQGTLGELRDTYGIGFVGNKFNNSVEDEQDITNFRVISDYMTSLMQSWIANRNFFRLGTKRPAFLGTQLVLISRQFTTICETVNEVRFALDSVFIGPNERQTLLLEFASPSLAPMFLEDVIRTVETASKDELPRLLRDGGKISVTNNILPVVVSLKNLIEEAHVPRNIDDLPDGFKTARVRKSLDDLQDQLELLIELIGQIEQQVPPSEDKLTVAGVTLSSSSTRERAVLSIVGSGFDAAAAVEIHSKAAQCFEVEFYSAQRIDVAFDPGSLGPPATHDIIVTNPDDQTATLAQAFAVKRDGTVETLKPPPGKRELPPQAAGTRGRPSPPTQPASAAEPSSQKQVEQHTSPAEGKPVISDISDPTPKPQGRVISIFGDQFEPGAKVSMYSPEEQKIAKAEFYSAQRIDVTIDEATAAKLGEGYHTIEITNPDGQSTILRDAVFVKKGAGGRYIVTKTAPADAGKQISRKPQSGAEIAERETAPPKRRAESKSREPQRVAGKHKRRSSEPSSKLREMPKKKPPQTQASAKHKGKHGKAA